MAQQVRGLGLRKTDAFVFYLAGEERAWLSDGTVKSHQLVRLSRQTRRYGGQQQKSESKRCSFHGAVPRAIAAIQTLSFTDIDLGTELSASIGFGPAELPQFSMPSRGSLRR